MPFSKAAAWHGVSRCCSTAPPCRPESFELNQSLSPDTFLKIEAFRFTGVNPFPPPLTYEGPPVNNSPGVKKPPPGGPRGAPRKAGGVTSILKRSLGRFARKFSGPNSCILFFNGFLASGASKSG
jgi:hypothetical protein